MPSSRWPELRKEMFSTTWIRRILSAEEWPGGHVGAVADMVLVV
jgi:hypothetical protein